MGHSLPKISVVLTQRLVGNACMHARCIQFHLLKPADWIFSVIHPKQCRISAKLGNSCGQDLSFSFCYLSSDYHESKRAFVAGSVLEKALFEQGETQSLQSHVGSFIRFRNGEFTLTNSCLFHPCFTPRLE